jgi:hypothetical protein
MKATRIFWELKNNNKTVAKGTNPYSLTRFLNTQVLEHFDWDKQIEGVNYSRTEKGVNYFLRKNHGYVTVTKVLSLHFYKVSEDDDRFALPFDSSIQNAIAKALSK